MYFYLFGIKFKGHSFSFFCFCLVVAFVVSFINHGNQ